MRILVAIFALTLAPVRAEALEIGKILKIRVTEYCLVGRMANGKRVHSGAVAADRHTFRFNHTRFHFGGREYLFEDTGSSVRGYHIDKWVSTCYEAIHWGSRVVTVRVHA